MRSFTIQTHVFRMSPALLAGLVMPYAHSLTLNQQADSYFARGVAAETKGDWIAARNCYSLTLRVVSGHAGAQARMKEVEKRFPVVDPLTVVLPQFALWRPTPLADAIESLRRQFEKTTRGNPSLKVTIEDSSGSLQRKTLTHASQSNITIVAALNTICQKTGAQFDLKGNALVLFPAGKRPPPAEKPDAAAPSGNPQAAPAMASSNWLDWTNTSGKTIKAAFVGIEAKSVVLKTPEGKTFRFPLSNLTPAGQAMATSLQKRNVPK